MNSRRHRRLSDYSRALRRQKLALLIPALVLAIATAVALGEMPNMFESKASLGLTPLKGDDATDLAGRLQGFRRQVTSREFLEAVVSKHQLRGEPLEAVVSQMRERIFVEPERGRYSRPEAFNISYRATDPETARKVTDELAGRLAAQSSNEASSSNSEPEALRKRAADISIQLRAREEKNPWLIDSRSELSDGKPSQPTRRSALSAEAIRAQEMSIESLKDQQYKIQQQLADVDRRTNTQRQIVEQQKKGSTLRDNPTYAVLIAKRTELQGKRDTLINRQELTDKHPRVLSINDQIAAINRQIEELRQQDLGVMTQSPEARELAALESERNRLKIDLEVAGRELARRAVNPTVQAAATDTVSGRRDAVGSKLAQEYLGLKRSYKEVTSNLQDTEARLKLNDGASLAQLRVLESANLPDRPVSRNRALFISVAAAVGLAFGVVFASFAEAGRSKSLQEGRDVEHYTRLPLLVALPRTAIATERRRDRLRTRARLAYATAISVVATLAIAKILIVSDILALLARN